jgi:Co/Zn/Cd efflux system component
LLFLVELWGGLHAGSVSLLADAVDFFGDAVNYGLSLTVLALLALRTDPMGLPSLQAQRCRSVFTPV